MYNNRGVGGFSVELFQDLANRLQYKGIVQELPWARCLADVKDGKIDIAIDAYDAADRRKIYFYSNAYYTLTPQIFYRSGTPNLPTSTVATLAKLRGCGLRGYTYEHYSIDASKLELGATSDKQLIEKLIMDRCDYGIEELEYVIGWRNYDADWLNESKIESFKPVWAQAPSVHFLISKEHANAVDLITAINNTIKDQEKQGFIKALQVKYFQTSIRKK
jgi:polar amino acid transport system substrate-binding protein